MRESDNDKCSVTVKKYVGLHLILFAAGLQLSRKNVTALRIDCKKIRLGGLGVYSRGSKNEEETRD